MPTAMDRYDLAVVGAGTAGLIAAQVAVAAGARVALLERARTGGDCLWTGCVPSKALLAAASTAHTIRHADRVGIRPSEPEIDRAEVAAHVRRAQADIAPQDSPERLRAMGIDVLDGHARFTSRDRLDVDGRSISFRAAVIATGSTPVVPDALAGVGSLTTDTVWDALEDLPERLAVVGGGPTGCELSQAFSRLGHDVTLVESAAQLLPALDADVGAAVAQQLASDAVHLRRGTSVTAASASDDGVRLGLDGDRDGPTVDGVIVAAGRRAVTDGLGLAAAGVQTDRAGAVVVDDTLRTATTNIFAAGDVVGGPDLTHLAAHHGATAATNALFLRRQTVQRRAIPLVVYTDPEIAHVGTTADHARRSFPDDTQVVVLGFDETDRAITDGRTDGWIRLVAVRDRLVGATIVAPHAGESISALADVVRRRGSIADVAATLHPYPTYSIAAYQAAARHRLAGLVDERVRAVNSRVLDVLRIGADLRRRFTSRG